MTVYVASARIDENGKAYGGKAGDQNGKEKIRKIREKFKILKKQ